MSNNQSLIKHIKNVLHLVFDEEADGVDINLFDRKEGEGLYEEIIRDYQFEFLIVIDFNKTIGNIKEKNSKLSKLTGKKIYLDGTGDNTKIYWFEGLQKEIVDVEKPIELEPTLKVDRLKTETRLPNWLDKFIFEKLEAKYEPDFEKFDYNLELTKEELLIYLGTYFPRSYAESFCIFDDLLANRIIKTELNNKSEIDVLDIGCGTGGNLIGLLSIFNKNLKPDISVNIWAIDGNKEALNILEQIISKFRQSTTIKINFNQILQKFTNISELQEIVDNLPYQTFDIIMSFKTICEIILKGYGSQNQSYYELTELACRKLENEGLFIILDVTTKTPLTKFLPIHLNEQVRSFTKENTDFKILSPLSCYNNSISCNNQCFYQVDFFVSHKQRSTDVSKVAYKIVGRKVFVESICKEIKNGKFVINWKKFNNDLGDDGCCVHSIGLTEHFDAFKISRI